MTKTELKGWMWQWLSPYVDQYTFMDAFDAKLDRLAECKADKLPISNVIVSEDWINSTFPFENELDATETRPVSRIHAYNQRQMDRRQGARMILEKISS